MKKIALVTGGTRGIGAAIAQYFLVTGHHVIVTGTKDNKKFNSDFEYFGVDFLDEDSLADFRKFVQSQPIDILINNAGINKIGHFELLDIKDFDNILRVNLRTPFLLIQDVIPYMKRKKWGRIVNITSIFGNVSKELRAPYSASKFGLDGMTVALSAELSEFGILANSVGPGVIDTELTQKILGKNGIKKLVNGIPMKRLGKPEEIAKFVYWLSSEENTYLTGQNIMIDGGFSRV